MKKHILILIFLLIRGNFLFSQSISGDYKQKSYVTYSKDFETLYKKCKSSRLDSIHRICIGFMNDYGIRKDEKKLNSFCQEFFKKCKIDDNSALARRIKIIELTNRLKLSNTSDQKLNQEFKKLFVSFFNENDYSAALECLFEQAMIYNKRENKVETLKILFFCENFAKNYDLKKDLCYQRVLHEIGHKLLYFEKNKLAIDYFKGSLSTKNSSTMDSLISLNGIGLAYQELNKFKESNKYLEIASITALKAKNYLFNNVINGTIALNKFKLEDYYSSYKYAYLEKNVSLKNELWSNCIGSMCLLTQIELKRNNITHAKFLIDSINSLMPKANPKDYVLLKRQYETNYLFFNKINNAEKALKAYQKYNYYEQLFQSQANKDKISMLQFKASTDVFNLEIKKIASRKKTKDFLILLSFVFLGFVIVYLIVYYLKKIKQIEKTKTEIKELNLKQTAEIEKLKKELYNQLDFIKSNYSNLPDENEDVQILKDFNLSKQEQWESFKVLFSKTYPHFLAILSLQPHKITNSEMRLIMLHKLGLNNKEISQALFISMDGVKKANYRLYKKFNVNSSLELIEIFK